MAQGCAGTSQEVGWLEMEPGVINLFFFSSPRPAPSGVAFYPPSPDGEGWGEEILINELRERV